MAGKTEAVSANRRQFIRVAPDRQAPVRVHINGDGFIDVTNAIDISEGGIRISIKHRFAGCHVDLPASFIIHLPAPISTHFSARGHIKHVLGDSFGVEFVALSPASRTLIQRYIRQLVPGAFASAGLLGQFRHLFGRVR